MGIVLLVPRCRWQRLAGTLWQARWGLLACAIIANAPDLDFIPGLLMGAFNAFHHGPSHSLFWALLVAMGVGALVQAFRPETWMVTAGVVFALIAGHVGADWSCQDLAAPYGVMLFWPFDLTYYLSPAPVFLAMEKATLSDVFTAANLGPARHELAVGCACIVAALATRLGKH